MRKGHWTTEADRFRHSKTYTQWKARVRAAHDGKCAECGSTHQVWVVRCSATLKELLAARAYEDIMRDPETWKLEHGRVLCKAHRPKYLAIYR